MKGEASFDFGYFGPEWNKKIQNKDNPNFWKYGVANLAFLDLMKGRKRILDIGCGTGGSTLFLAQHTRIDRIIGIDPVRTMIKVAKQQALQKDLHEKAIFVICEGRHLPFRRSCFDALVSRGDAFVFLVPQEMALLEFKKVLRSGAIVIIELDNVRWKPGTAISSGFEELADGNIAYSMERFDLNRNRVKTFYILDPKGKIAQRMLLNNEFALKGRLRQRFPLKRIKEETIEIRQSAVTHWPTVDEIEGLFASGGFRNIEILGNGLLMGLFLEADRTLKKVMKKQPEQFFKLEQRLIPFIDPRKANTIILNATMP